MVGCKHYMAPEILTKQAYDPKGDIWAATCVVYCLMIGKMPFKGDNWEEIKESINKTDWDREFKQAHWSHISSKAKNFIKKGFEIYLNKRFSAQKMLNHQWLKDVGETIQAPI